MNKITKEAAFLSQLKQPLFLSSTNVKAIWSVKALFFLHSGHYHFREIA
jgi:hypothetical protein